MIEFRLSVEALGQTTFAYSPLAEVASSLRVLGTPSPGSILQPWLAEVRGSLQTIDLDLLRSVAPPGHWAADFLFSWSPDPKMTIEQQLEALEALPAESLRADLEQVWRDRTMPAPARALVADWPQGWRRLADAFWNYWQVAIAPYWSRMRAVVDDDVAYRAERVLSGGLYELLSDLHPEVTLHDRVLRINKRHHAASFFGTEISLIPSVFIWPNLIIGEDTSRGLVEIIYAARGVGRVWEGLGSALRPTDALAALLGRTRATILKRLGTPMTTTQLARELGQSPSGVSTHLSVLRSNGLLTSWRSGRSVYYRSTPLASSFIAMSGLDVGLIAAGD